VNVRWGPKRITALLAGAVWSICVAAPSVPAGAAPASAPPASSGLVVPGGAPDPLAGLKAPGDIVVLSDEVRTTRWAHVQAPAKILTAPVADAKTITRLRYLTEDKLPEVYVVLEGRLDSARQQWLRIRIPMRPHGRTGWVLADDMSALYTVSTRLVIDRGALRATLFKQGRRIWQAPVVIGKAGTPTPRGRFWIRELLKGLGDGTTYGPWAFGTSAYSNISDWPGIPVVGIHGTNQPSLIPGRASLGCVRVRNDKIRTLARLMPIGTPVEVVG